MTAALVFSLSGCCNKPSQTAETPDYATIDSILTANFNLIISGKDAKVGIGIIYDNHEYSLNNELQYPVMSVFKLPIALTVLHKIETEGISLDSIFTITPAQMIADTYSPLRDKHPNQAIEISLRDIIRYTVSHSDNNTCDWLIAFVGGIDTVDRHIRSLGLDNFKYQFTEDEMHQNMLHCYDNWSTPLEMSRLLYRIYNDSMLVTANLAFIKETMFQTPTGQNKLKAGLPSDARLEHKTGHSDRLHESTQIADCDAGVVYLPDNKQMYITVFIKDSRETDATNAAIIADVARIAYKTMTNQN